jgi:hypothetical protein
MGCGVTRTTILTVNEWPVLRPLLDLVAAAGAR